MRQVVEGLAHVGVVRTERLFADRQRVLVQPLRFAVVALRPIQVGQIVQALAHVGVVRTERLLADRQCAFVEPLRLRVLALCLNHDAQSVERNSVVWMIGSEACLHQPLMLLRIDLGGGVVSARVMIPTGLVDRLDVGRLGRCGRECSEGREYKDRDKSDRLTAPSRYHGLYQSRWPCARRTPDRA